ncbi:DNA-processing protein DprA [Nereida sp. MMG025]|uniref:DNA-processing protein DprA n=1 Tax=Nereida sp. MMG025 TaxID=2909981 RepID=UPI001F002E58|nr:DNA-processing protein DprA [Nereida sp. MMG025]MCF6445029.1 DNA-processing protein DprA [Nereida sp. MMG025]
MTEETPTLSSFHPPLPPTTEEQQVSWLRLLRSRRVGISTFYRLLTEHGSADAALAALPQIAQSAGVKGYQICPEGVVRAELANARRIGAKMLCRGAPDYPAALTDLDDAPPILWAMGDVSLLKRPMVAMVGARNASSLGTRMASTMARELGAADIVVVSGLARGIDTAAHIAALKTGTIAVQAGGVDQIYPAENTQLHHDIAKTGLRLSEQPMGMTPTARHFPRRNRIISGLSRATVVIEAAAKSGSLITARNALDQGRDVLAVPGHPFDARASGCNMLLRDGATLVRGAADILEVIGTAPAPELPFPPPQDPPSGQPRSLRQTAALHTQILDRLGPTPVPQDQLCRDLKTTADAVTPVLLELEMDGKLVRHAGGLLARAS